MTPDETFDQTQRHERLRELAVTTVAALRVADLPELVELLQDRLFNREVDELFEPAGTVDGEPAVRFKPMVELLLRHLQATAEESTLSDEARRREMHWAFEAAGF